MVQAELMLDLTLPLGQTQNKRKSYYTERPQSDRRLGGPFKNSMRAEELEQMVGKKYMRTAQLTTKRNNRNTFGTPIESKHTESTLKLSDSPKSIVEQ